MYEKEQKVAMPMSTGRVVHAEWRAVQMSWGSGGARVSGVFMDEAKVSGAEWAMRKAVKEEVGVGGGHRRERRRGEDHVGPSKLL